MNKFTIRAGVALNVPAHFSKSGIYLKLILTTFLVLFYVCLGHNLFAQQNNVALSITPVHVSIPGACDGSVFLQPSGGTAPYVDAELAYSFNGSAMNQALFSSGGGVFTQNNELSMTGGAFAGWGNYVFTNETFARKTGKMFQSRIKADYNGYGMIGWHNGSTDPEYDNMTHAFYFASDYLYIFEDGQYRTYVGHYPSRQWYDIRIELLNEGANYYIKESASAKWDLVYTSGYSGESNLRPGISFYSYSYYSYGGLSTDDWLVKENTPLSGLCAGNYTYSVCDANGYHASAEVTITEPGFLGFNSDVQHVSCYGLANGSVTIHAAGGLQPYTYSNDNGAHYQSSNTFNGLSAGTYSFIVKDAAGISSGMQKVSLSAPAPLNLAASVSSVSCYGGNNGAIMIAADGGAIPYSYSWSNGAVSQGISGLPAGNYSVTVTDANGCQAVSSVNLVQPEPLSVSAGADQQVYFGYAGASACALLAAGGASGGTAPYSYKWSNGSSAKSINVCPDQNSVYSLTVTDANGCSFTDEVAVSVTDVRCGIKNDKVLICRNGKTLCVSPMAVALQLAQGAYLGSCKSEGRMAGESAEVSEVFSADERMELKAYPNPFTDKVRIEMISTQADEGQLILADIAGRTIAVLYEGHLEAGQQYAFEYSSENLIPGMYFYKLQTGSETIMKKLVLVK